MSIATDNEVKILRTLMAGLAGRVTCLENQVIALQESLIEGDADTDDLAARYEAKFKAPPHHRMKRETIERALRE